MNFTKGVNLTKEVFTILADKEWHSLGQILNDVGCKISPEKASQFFLSRNCRKGDQSSVPLEEQVRKGRRAAILRAIEQLDRTKRIESRGVGFSREFRKISDTVFSYRKRSPNITVPVSSNPKTDKQEEIIELIERAEMLFGEICPENTDNTEMLDFSYQCRQLKKAVKVTRERHN